MREGRVALLGREQIFGGEWVVRSAGLTHFRRSHSRVRVLFIRLPCPRREIKAMGPKDAPCEHPSPAKTSAPAPSAFTLPRPRSPSPAYPLASRRMMFAPSTATFTLPPRRSQFSHEAFGGAHEDFGLPQQQLSTMGYPRKSYPHRCSPPCAKRARPRACARVYIIYRSPVGRSRGVSAPLWGRGRTVVTPCPAPACAGWGRAKAKADAPSRSAPHFPCLRPRTCPLMSESLCAKAECTRQSPPLPCVLPATACLPPRPRPLMGEAPSAKAEVHQANPAPARAFSPRQLAYCRAPAR